MACRPSNDRLDTERVSLWSPRTGGEKTAVPYTIVWKSPQRFAGGTQLQSVDQLLSTLRANGLLWYLPPELTDPFGAKPPIVADEGQRHLRIETGELWVMQSAV